MNACAGPFVAATFALVVMLALFLPAGRLDLPFFWAYVGIYAAVGVTAGLFLDRGLLRERLRPGPGGTDRATVAAARLFVMAHLVVAGLDAGRFGWSGPFPPGVQIAGLAACTAGLGLSVWSMLVNRFFSPLVRIQAERGHHLVRGGPYRFVRHPGYAGVTVALLASPLALGSWWSLIPAVLAVAAILRRTVVEDRYLRGKLPGYAGYAGDVPYRLLPGVW